MLALLSNSAVATTHDNYPNRPISMVGGYAPGGATDMLARLIAKALTDELEQPVIVENKAGANSNIAAEHVVRSKKDGYTIFVGIIGNTIDQIGRASCRERVCQYVLISAVDGS